MSAEQFLEHQLAAERDMANVAGMTAINRRLGRLGVVEVDMTACDHGPGCEALAPVRGVVHKFTIHGARSTILALEQLADEIEAFRRTGRRLEPKG